MFRTQGVLALLALYVGLGHSFSWEIVLQNENNLLFYKNGQLTHKENIPMKDYYTINTIAYNPVHKNLLLSIQDYPNAISSFDMVTKKLECVVRRKADVISFAVDPPTQTIFMVESKEDRTEFVLYSFALKPGSGKSGDGRILLSSAKCFGYITVDSCGGYIYWEIDRKIEKARFDGSQREVLIDLDTTVDFVSALVIDQQTQKLYWIEQVEKYKSYYESSVNSADLNGLNRRTVYRHTYDTIIKPLTVSNDFIYWGDWQNQIFWQIPKIPPHDRHVKPIKTIAEVDFCSNCNFAAYYKALENQTCAVLKSTHLNDSVPTPSDHLFNGSTDVSLFCVHGTKVSRESRCVCTQGYIGERCDVAACHNYCFEGNCSVSAEGHPKCRCNSTYSGERCEFNACYDYCLNNGSCSLNEKNEPVCQCTGNYEGRRCNVPVLLVKCFKTFSKFRDFLNTDITPDTLDIEVKSTCTPTVV